MQGKISIIEQNLHAVYDLEYHLVIVTKYRHPVLNEEVKASLLSHTYRLFETNFDCKVLEVNTDKNHIHILLLDLKFQLPLQYFSFVLSFHYS